MFQPPSTLTLPLLNVQFCQRMVRLRRRTRCNCRRYDFVQPRATGPSLSRSSQSRMQVGSGGGQGFLLFGFCVFNTVSFQWNSFGALVALLTPDVTNSVAAPCMGCVWASLELFGVMSMNQATSRQTASTPRATMERRLGSSLEKRVLYRGLDSISCSRSIMFRR